jgi:GNAT superfamily N-acetyltransferase
MALRFDQASDDDAEGVAAVLAAAARHLTSRHGRGRWSWTVGARSVLAGIRSSRVLVARERGRIVASLRLTTRRPGAIRPEPFTPVKRPLYLVDMAVLPGRQGRSLGRLLLEHAEAVARTWPAEAIRLNAFAGPAGAGPFYARCGYREVARASHRGVPLIYYEHLLVSAPGSAGASRRRGSRL